MPASPRQDCCSSDTHIFKDSSLSGHPHDFTHSHSVSVTGVMQNLWDSARSSTGQADRHSHACLVEGKNNHRLKGCIPIQNIFLYLWVSWHLPSRHHTARLSGGVSPLLVSYNGPETQPTMAYLQFAEKWMRPHREKYAFKMKHVSEQDGLWEADLITGWRSHLVIPADKANLQDVHVRTLLHKCMWVCYV